MTRVLLLIVLSIAFSTAVRAQSPVTIPFLFTSDDDNRFIRENDSLRFFVADDTSKIVAMNDEANYYYLYTRDKKLVDEGPFVVDGDKFLQEGKWTRYYGDGKVKVTGYYRRSKPVGTWQEFYSNGKLRTIYNFAICIDDVHGAVSCLSGTFQQYYNDGKTKATGFYGAVMTPSVDTQYVVDPVTGSTVYKLMKSVQVKAAKTGHWEYFTVDGELEKKEDIMP